MAESAGVAHAQTLKGLDPSRWESQYVMDAWGSEEGLPSNAIMATTQSPDGYLWFATYNGLVRFDGIAFDVYNKQTRPEFSNNGVLALNAPSTPDYYLLIGTNGGGLMHLTSSGELQKFPGDSVLQSRIITSIVSDGHGAYWVGTRSGVYQFHQGQFTQLTISHDLLNANVYQLAMARNGVLWVATSGGGVFAYKDDAVIRYTTKQGLPSNAARSVLEDRQGNVWIGTDNGLAKLTPIGTMRVYQAAEGLPHPFVNALWQDDYGTVWIGTDEGLGRYPAKGIVETVGYETVVDGQTIESLLFDHEGSLWVGTYRSGIVRVQDGKFLNFSLKEGLPNQVVNAVLPEGSVTWIGTDDGLASLEGTSLTAYKFSGAQGRNRIRDMLRDSQGRLWLASYDGLLHIEGGRVVRKIGQQHGLTTNRTRNLSEDAQGHLWVGTSSGLNEVDPDAPEPVLATYNLASGLKNDFILASLPDNEGNVWVATNGAGLYRLHNGSLTHFGIDDGLASEVVFRMSQDQTGGLWICTNAGLSYYHKGRFSTIDARQGLISDAIFQAIEDDYGNMWFTANKGALKVDLEQLRNVATGITDSLATPFSFYSKADGLRTNDITGVSASAKGLDGHIYLATQDGISIIDPGSIGVNKQVPPIVIQKVKTNRPARYGEDGTLYLRPGTKRFELPFTGLSFKAPERMQFRYKLEGFDTEWQDFEGTRSALYTNLSPGTYRFRVIAANNDGLWNEEGASLTIEQEAYFYQTLWFYLLTTTLLVGISYLIYRWRTRRYKQRNQELQRMVNQRTRDIQKQNDAIRQQSLELEAYFAKMTDSISYARRIQDALMQSMESIRQQVPDSFIYYRPKDVVSGDFYWFDVVGHKLIFAAVDCTGHGVPGAFMSVLGNTLLNQVVRMQGITEPDAILHQLNYLTVTALKQTRNEAQTTDGMDAALVVLDTKARTISYSGAKRPFWYLSGNVLNIIKGGRKSIGGEQSKDLTTYVNHTLPIDEVDFFYIFSDGLTDQFGEESGKKFMNSRLKALIAEIHTLPAKEQHSLMHKAHVEWQGSEEQVDDILMVGVRPASAIAVAQEEEAMQTAGHTSAG